MLTSLQNPLVKEIRKLHKTQERHRQNLHLLEGTNLLEVATKVNYPLVTVLATQLWQKKHYSLWEALQTQAERIETVSPELMKNLATTVNPDGIIATAYRDSRQSQPTENLRLGLIGDRIQDPGNLGTIIRTAVATDVDFLWLSGDSVDLDNPKVMRSSVGEWFKIQAKVENDLVSLIKKYQSQGYQIIATSLEGNKTHWQIDFTKPTILLLGNEAQGLSPELANLATETVKIPLANGVESLNVAMATAFLLAEYQRQIINSD
ncbi:RNA methyltransferase [Geminocystis sp. NIES-3708]|uniref:TrmH family RNA methyltransferase n=1 Tax=Geminocystis sp. NIES-3708 TaxID=1615909 RepID=UPI0005FCD21C|nr:RNA methyltransferase [Geminocystis sp. NIES-3708]BAQ60955.1 RNA methyltransferase [Geminocystis sp. NIES-3708]